jgi:hypothetical protein
MSREEEKHLVIRLAFKCDVILKLQSASVN